MYNNYIITASEVVWASPSSIGEAPLLLTPGAWGSSGMAAGGFERKIEKIVGMLLEIEQSFFLKMASFDLLRALKVIITQWLIFVIKRIHRNKW